jgi:hypothetical protein
MKQLFVSAARVALVSVFALTPLLARSEKHSGQVVVQAVTGEVTCSTAKGAWQRVGAKDQLDCGVVFKTGPDATVDLALGYNRTVLRLTPNSILRVAKLDEGLAGDDVVTEITLELTSGALAGSQRKLTLPSRLDVVTPKGVARIMGTEYYVRADGAVSVVSGSVMVQYNQPGSKKESTITVAAGYSFDPVTQTVVPTTPAYLQEMSAHIVTTRNNAQTLKVAHANGGPTLERFMSPSKPKGNNGVGNGVDPQPPGNPPINDGPGTGPGNPGNKGGKNGP